MDLYRKILNRDKLQELLDCFVEITNIRAVYFNEMDSIVGNNMNSCDFCIAIRRLENIDGACMDCDASAMAKARESRSPYLYSCHIGLWEAVIPLYIKDILIGYLMLGQVKSSESNDQWPRIEELLVSNETGEISKAKTFFGELPFYSLKQIKAAVKMLEIIAQNIIANNIIKLYNADSVEKAKEYLQEHFTEYISITKLSRELGISTSSLATIFKKQTGTTISVYIEIHRMEKAKELLSITSLSIKEISYLCGYEDQNYFSRVFKKLVGISPKIFRETIGNNANICI